MVLKMLSEQQGAYFLPLQIEAKMQSLDIWVIVSFLKTSDMFSFLTGQQ